MSTPTVYARVTDELKEAVSEYASNEGMSLASAIADLLTRGLEAVSSDESVRTLETRTHQLQAEMSQVQQAAAVMDGRLRQVLGSCACGTPLSGRDFLVTGCCPNCERGITNLLVGVAASDDDLGRVYRSELAPFLAGVGTAAAVMALLFAASKS